MQISAQETPIQSETNASPESSNNYSASGSDGFTAAAAAATADLGPDAGQPGAQTVEHEGVTIMLTPAKVEKWLNYLPEMLAKLAEDDSFLFNDFERELIAPYFARQLSKLLAMSDDPERAAFLLGLGFYSLRVSPACRRIYLRWQSDTAPKPDHVMADRTSGVHVVDGRPVKVHPMAAGMAAQGVEGVTHA